MIENFIIKQINHFLNFQPTQEQNNAINSIANFLTLKESSHLLLIKGYAGTGKTSLLGAVVKAMTEMKQNTILLAPTGRAAKVFSEYAHHPAFTIHKKIYRQKAFANEAGGFSLSENLHKHTLFIVDEASMIANRSTAAYTFGTGRLLDDLIHYVYSGEQCKLILLGDNAQLPPVSETESPALNSDYLKGYQLEVHQASLTQVVRQNETSGILHNATMLRECLRQNKISIYPKLKLDIFPDLKKISGEELIDAISFAYSRDGIDDTMIICRSNKRATVYNRGIRERILYREEEVSSGDRLMIVKNNYYWSQHEKSIDFMANGEIVQVLRIRRTEELHGFRFCLALVRLQDYDIELEVRILLDTLTTETPALPKELNDKLFYSVLEDYSDIRIKSERMKKLKNDSYFNALQIKYAYAITCHKAQGGQWRNVFLDLGYITEEMMGEDFYRWLYTAITRATEKLYFVNLPKEFDSNN